MHFHERLLAVVVQCFKLCKFYHNFILNLFLFNFKNPTIKGELFMIKSPNFSFITSIEKHIKTF